MTAAASAAASAENEFQGSSVMNGSTSPHHVWIFVVLLAVSGIFSTCSERFCLKSNMENEHVTN